MNFRQTNNLIFNTTRLLPYSLFQEKPLSEMERRGHELAGEEVEFDKKLADFRGRRSEMVKAITRIPLEIKVKRTIDELVPMQCSWEGAKIIYFGLSEEKRITKKWSSKDSNQCRSGEERQ